MATGRFIVKTDVRGEFRFNLEAANVQVILSHEGYNTKDDFRHGTIAIIQPAFPIITVAPSGATLAGMLDLLDKLAARQARPLVISDSADALAKAAVPMAIPAGIPEWLTPIVAVIPGQLFALRLAIAKGHSVDTPRGLTKVTVTR